MRKASIGRKVTGIVASGFVASTLALCVGAPVAFAASQAVMPAQIQDVVAPVIPNNASINQAQNWLQSAIDGRIQDLAALSNLVSQVPTKTIAPDKSALNTIINTASSGLSTLEQNSSDDGTLRQLRADSATMVLNFRVYSFVDPMVKTVVLVDTASAALQADIALEPGIEAALAVSQLSGKNLTTANADLADMTSVLDTGSAVVSGDSSGLEALTASNYPQTTTAIVSAKHDASAAQDEITEANSDVTQIVHLLTNVSLTSHLKGEGAIRAFFRHYVTR